MVEPIVIEGQRAWLKQYGKEAAQWPWACSISLPAVSIWTPCGHRRTVVVMPREKPKPVAWENCRRKA